MDTSVIVDHLRGDVAAIELLRSIALANEQMIASEVVRFELLAGVRDREVEALELFFDAVNWIPVDEEISRTAGDLARRHRKAYSGIDDADYLIAATAISLRADLLTVNVKHFPMLRGLVAAY